LTDQASQRRQRLMGIALMCCAVALFACLDTTAKYLNTQMATLEIVWARYTSVLSRKFADKVARVSGGWSRR
jgi:hypothetical protein